MSRNSAQPIEDMDLVSQANLKRILRLEPNQLTEEDRGFMRARQDYLTADEVKDYVTDAPAPAQEETTNEEEEVSYDKMTVAELKAELEARDLSTDGKKADLVARLQDND